MRDIQGLADINTCENIFCFTVKPVNICDSILDTLKHCSRVRWRCDYFLYLSFKGLHPLVGLNHMSILN